MYKYISGIGHRYDLRLRSPNLPVATVSEVVRSKSANARLSRWCAQCGTFRARVRHTLFFIYVKTRRRGATDEAPTGRKRKHTPTQTQKHTLFFILHLSVLTAHAQKGGVG